MADKICYGPVVKKRLGYFLYMMWGKVNIEVTGYHI